MAGATKRDLLADMRAAVEKCTAAGGTLEQFRTDFDRIVQQHGWQYNSGRDWWTQVIWETNLRQPYSAGREVQMADPERRKRPYLGLSAEDAAAVLAIISEYLAAPVAAT